MRQGLTSERNSERNRKGPPKGCLFKRRGRYWYKITLPRASKPSWFKLVLPGQKFATTIKDFAVTLAWQVYRQHYEAGLEAKPADLLERFGAMQRLRAGERHVRQQVEAIRRFLDAAKINRPDEITPAAITAYMVELSQAGRSPKTITNVRATVARYCEWLRREHLLAYNPVVDTDAPKVPKQHIVYLTRPELDKALAIATEKNLHAVLWAIYTGMRLEEITEVKWTHIQRGPSGWTVIIPKTKSDEPQSIPLHEKLVDMLKTLPRDSEYVLPERRYWYLSEVMLRPLKAAIPTLAQPGQGWHTLRRTFASLLLQSGSKIQIVSRLLRHGSIAVTEAHYGHLVAEAGRADLEKL